MVIEKCTFLLFYLLIRSKVYTTENFTVITYCRCRSGSGAYSHKTVHGAVSANNKTGMSGAVWFICHLKFDQNGYAVGIQRFPFNNKIIFLNVFIKKNFKFNHSHSRVVCQASALFWPK